MGRSKHLHFRQRAAGWCEAVGNDAQIPPGAACLKSSRGGRVRPIQREPLLDGLRDMSRGIFKPEVVPCICALCPQGQGAFLI